MTDDEQVIIRRAVRFIRDYRDRPAYPTSERMMSNRQELTACAKELASLIDD